MPKKLAIAVIHGMGCQGRDFADSMRDDILGYPLKPINPAYRRVVSRDITINVGGILSSWNPASHTKYWTDNDFTVPAAEFVGRLL